jgi:hypothetical protein
VYQVKSRFGRNKNVDDDKVIQTICNKIPEFKAAPEPTNIIWENRHISGWNYFARVQAIALVSFFMLLLAFYAIYAFKKYQIVVVNQWPNVNCESLTKSYTVNGIKKFAGYEYDDQVRTNHTAPMVGALKCFCQSEKKSISNPLTVMNKQYSYTNVKGVALTHKICETYIK